MLDQIPVCKNILMYIRCLLAMAAAKTVSYRTLVATAAMMTHWQWGGMKHPKPGEETYPSLILVTWSAITHWHIQCKHSLLHTRTHTPSPSVWEMGGHAPPAPPIMACTCLPCHLCSLIVSFSYAERSWRHPGFLTGGVCVHVCVCVCSYIEYVLVGLVGESRL